MSVGNSDQDSLTAALHTDGSDERSSSDLSELASLSTTVDYFGFTQYFKTVLISLTPGFSAFLFSINMIH